MGVPRWPGIWVVLAVLASPATAQDALRGKRLYLDGGRMSGAGISCVDCHGGYPGALHGIGRAAGRPAVIEYALGSVSQMGVLRGSLSPEDVLDLAAYLQDPDVPSPQLSIKALPDENGMGVEWLEFVADAGGRSEPRHTVQLRNVGGRPLTLAGLPRIEGASAAAFRLTNSTCRAGEQLAPGSECMATMTFTPEVFGTNPGPWTAYLVVAHDWVGAGARVAFVGRVAREASPPAARRSGRSAPAR